ncbi:hypothetical protein SAMN05428985_11074 [Nocardioides sp. YR527]|uniref:hypothetical protein n=1 Tax=Nocardioides sp. YR527 TaxID=1881028 RepID=UPI00088B88F0|nr:hypothetical protein [Nocardioides sp. YR527]SDL15170.1 hypothetical protein SAMN05428985_11074 [Nocardioides sp. YR527]
MGGHTKGLAVDLIADPDDPRHGTTAGHWAHHRADVPQCDPCLIAKARYDKQRRVNDYQGKVRKVSTLGARRRIEALQAIGWTNTQIAEAAGFNDRQGLQYAKYHDQITVPTFERIATAYERLSMRVPPDSFGKSRAMAAARKNGWVPPLAWDDIDNDEAPAAAAIPPKPKPDRLALLQRADEAEQTAKQAAEEIGVSQEGLNRWCKRHGHMDLYFRLLRRDPKFNGNQYRAA